MATWTVGAARDLPLSKSATWDGAAAKRSVFSWAGWPDSPTPSKARRAFLLYDSSAGDLIGSYKLPFASVVSGTLTASPAGLRAAASRLPQTDAPQAALDRARSVLDGYFKRMGKAAMAYEQKVMPFTVTELKARDGGWEVAGYASTFGGDPDAYGDVVARGAFSDSLLARPKVPLLWQHDTREPIGKSLSLKEDDKGLLGHWSLVPTDVGTKAHQLLEHDLVNSLSIGFMTKDAEYREDGTRILKGVDLVEVSLVTVPANTNAVVTSFKADVPFDTLLTQATDALRYAVGEAEALTDRRGVEGRALNDRHSRAIATLLAEAKAASAALDALVVMAPEAEADELEAETLALRMALARRRYAAILREA